MRQSSAREPALQPRRGSLDEGQFAGIGLAIPLDQFSLRVDDAISIRFDPRLADDAALWRFALLDAPPHHLVAVGVETGGAALSLRARQVVPLREC